MKGTAKAAETPRTGARDWFLDGVSASNTDVSHAVSQLIGHLFVDSDRWWLVVHAFQDSRGSIEWPCDG